MNYMEHVHHPKDIWISHFTEIQERWHRGKDLSVTSLPTLDHKIWGLRKKKLVVIGARPSQGKSSLMLQFAWDFAKQGKKIYFFSLEMTKEDCIERLFCLAGGVQNNLIHTGQITEMMHLPNISDSLSNFTKEIENSKLVIIENQGKTFAEINEIVEGLGDADCVIIDYLQMIKEKTTTKEAIDEYIKDLRSYAIRNNFCVIIGSQINRSTFDGKKIEPPELHQLKGSGSIEEHCDMAILLHWKHFYDDEADDKEYWLRVAKNRNGRTGTFICQFYPEFYEIREKP